MWYVLNKGAKTLTGNGKSYFSNFVNPWRNAHKAQWTNHWLILLINVYISLTSTKNDDSTRLRNIFSLYVEAKRAWIHTLPTPQPGFRQGQSTETAFCEFSQTSLQLSTAVVLLLEVRVDSHAAFDTVNHELTRVQTSSGNDDTICLSSFGLIWLAGHSWFVVGLPAARLARGVPQGSVLGACSVHFVNRRPTYAYYWAVCLRICMLVIHRLTAFVRRTSKRSYRGYRLCQWCY